jgi:hypothetical protein
MCISSHREITATIEEEKKRREQGGGYQYPPARTAGKPIIGFTQQRIFANSRLNKNNS